MIGSGGHSHAAVSFDLRARKPDTLRAFLLLLRSKYSLFLFKVDLFVENDFFNIITRFSVKRVLSYYHGVHKDTKRPYIYLWIALCLPAKQFWRHVLNAASIVPFSHSSFVRTKDSEVGNFHMNFRWGSLICRKFVNGFEEDYILEFHITMDYPTIVTAFEP